MVGAGQLLTSEQVDLSAKTLGETTRVDENDGGSVTTDQFQDLGVDRLPDRAAGGIGVERIDLALIEVGHVLHRDDDLQIERARSWRIGDCHRTGMEAVLLVHGSAAEELGNRAEWPLSS